MWKLLNENKRNFNKLKRFASGEGGQLTLGQFGWVSKTARRCPRNPLFAAFVDYVKLRFPEDHVQVFRHLESISIKEHADAESLAECIAQIRNFCAHPTELSGDDSGLMTGATFEAIWNFEFRAPVELLRLLCRNGTTE